MFLELVYLLKLLLRFIGEKPNPPSFVWGILSLFSGVATPSAATVFNDQHEAKESFI
jgi:hypothetical protein